LADIIAGRVLQIIDNDTFWLDSNYFHRNNLNQYEGRKEIKIAKLELPKTVYSNNQTRMDLKSKIGKKFVLCEILEGDNSNKELKCNVFLAEKAE